MTIITLSNGKKVGNFSSPHPFIFEDGSILPAVSNEEAERLKVHFKEFEILFGYPGDIKLRFNLSVDVRMHMDVWHIKRNCGEVDVVFCPLPMITAIRELYTEKYLVSSPFRAIRMEDRIKKLVSIHKQCI